MENFTVCLTHDVDRVFKSYQYITKDLFKLRINNVKNLFTNNNPYWNFEKIMALEDKHNVRSTFFFLEETIPFKLFNPSNWKQSLGKYKFSDLPVKKVICKLDCDGWEIGLHGSLRSFNDKKLLKREKASLEKVLGKPVVGIRQHYLNLNIPDTWKIQKSVGFMYDSSLGLKQAVGFPNDIYHPFNDAESDMLVLPVALMDGYLFSRYKLLEKAWEKTLNLIDIAERKNGVLVVLWHQRVFNEQEFPGYIEIYEKFILECMKRQCKFKLCREFIK